MDEKNTQNNEKEFKFGNQRFGGSYRPGKFELNLPPELSHEEFEEMFKSRMESLYRFKTDIEDEYFGEEKKTKKEKLKPLSIRVKSHTKEFFKNHSILSAREVLEMYENFYNGSEAFINSLLEDEKQLQKDLEEIQEKLHNARLFKDKLTDLKEEIRFESDEDKIAKIKEEYPSAQIKTVEDNKPVSDIINDLKIYNTCEVSAESCEYLRITVATGDVPVIYYFKNGYSEEDFDEIIDEVRKCCEENEIEFCESEE